MGKLLKAFTSMRADEHINLVLNHEAQTRFGVIRLRRGQLFLQLIWFHGVRFMYLIRFADLFVFGRAPGRR